MMPSRHYTTNNVNINREIETYRHKHLFNDLNEGQWSNKSKLSQIKLLHTSPLGHMDASVMKLSYLILIPGIVLSAELVYITQQCITKHSN